MSGGRVSAAPTDCRVPDPSNKLDAKADGQFQAVNRRAGYGDDRLDRIIATARKGWTLVAVEGLVLVQEIDRLRDRIAAVEAERDRLLRDIQDAERYRCLRALLRHARWDYLDPISEMKPEFEKFVNDDDLDRALDAVIAVGKERAAVAAAEREVADDR